MNPNTTSFPLPSSPFSKPVRKKCMGWLLVWVGGHTSHTCSSMISFFHLKMKRNCHLVKKWDLNHQLGDVTEEIRSLIFAVFWRTQKCYTRWKTKYPPQIQDALPMQKLDLHSTWAGRGGPKAGGSEERDSSWSDQSR